MARFKRNHTQKQMNDNSLCDNIYDRLNQGHVSMQVICTHTHCKLPFHNIPQTNSIVSASILSASINSIKNDISHFFNYLKHGEQWAEMFLCLFSNRLYFLM